MARGIKEIQADTEFADELEPYYELVALQKRIISQAQQNDRTRAECTRLREQLVLEMFRPADTDRTIRRKVRNVFKQLPGVATAKSNLAVWFRSSPKNLQPVAAGRNYI